MRTEIPEEEYMCSGHLACPGCAAALSMRFALKALAVSYTHLTLPTNREV